MKKNTVKYTVRYLCSNLKKKKKKGKGNVVKKKAFESTKYWPQLVPVEISGSFIIDFSGNRVRPILKDLENVNIWSELSFCNIDGAASFSAQLWLLMLCSRLEGGWEEESKHVLPDKMYKF